MYVLGVLIHCFHSQHDEKNNLNIIYTYIYVCNCMDSCCISGDQRQSILSYMYYNYYVTFNGICMSDEAE